MSKQIGLLVNLYFSHANKKNEQKKNTKLKKKLKNKTTTTTMKTIEFYFTMVNEPLCYKATIKE